MKNSFAFTVDPSLRGARLARKEVSKFIREASVFKGEKTGIELVVAEWIANLAQHPGRVSDQVTVRLHSIGDTWLLEFEDNGSRFEKFGDWALHDGAPELSEQGMGLALISNYFPYRSYLTLEGKNRLRLQCHNGKKSEKPLLLFVDDDPVVRSVYGEYLAADYHLLLADSAEEAMCLLEQTNIDLVVSDINMPNGASGLDLCSEIRGREQLETIPLIFLTGKRDSETRHVARALAIDDYLIKPVKKEALLDSALRVLNNARYVRNRLGNKFDEQLTKLLHPSLPQSLGSFSSAVCWLAAEAGGGDILFHRRLEEKTLVVLADLMGHGAQAKFFSHALSGYLSGILAAVAHPSPKVLLDRLNVAFSDDPILCQTLATALVVLLHDNGRCFLANAGHPQPLLVSDKGISAVDIGGPLLGLSRDPQYTMTKIYLSPGQRIALYSDGLAEIGPDTETHRTNFLDILSTLERHKARPLQTVGEKLEKQIGDCLKAPSSDDITIALLEFLGG